MGMSFDSLPDVLTPTDLVKFLPLGRNCVYDLLSRGEIRSIRCGRKIIVTKSALGAFLCSKGEARVSHA